MAQCIPAAKERHLEEQDDATGVFCSTGFEQMCQLTTLYEDLVSRFNLTPGGHINEAVLQQAHLDALRYDLPIQDTAVLRTSIAAFVAATSAGQKVFVSP